ncbi:hypothetical protein [Succinimonas sp.]|uniref:hypothetical protein n=1 Tax=Succinimonas sp. TaxID=1936151 RepID=UPI00386381D9
MHDKMIAAVRQIEDNNGIYLRQPGITSSGFSEPRRKTAPPGLLRRSSGRGLRASSM